MKQVKLLLYLFGAFSIATVLSCNNSSTSETSMKDSSSTATTTTTTAPAAPVSNIDTMPQAMLTIRMKVANYEKWKMGFDARDSIRLANGLHKYVIGRGIPDSNMIQVTLKADDVAKAKAYIKDPTLKTAMQKAGVTSTPMFMVNKALYQDKSDMALTNPRVMVTFTVKDWNTWRSQFEANRSLRNENGTNDRVYGHDADDDHKAYIVESLSDTAKANAWYRNPAMKERQQKAGVVGEPKMFMYRIVERY